MARNRAFRTFAITFIMGMIGVIQAVIVYVCYVNGIVVDEMVTPTLTIENIMAIIIVAWSMIGAVVGVFI